MVSVLNDIYQALYFTSNLIRSEFAKIQHNCLTKTEAFIIYTCQLFTSTYHNISITHQTNNKRNYTIMSIQKLSYYSIQ